MVLLKTERLTLREFESSDWRAVHEYGADPEVVRYMQWGPNTEKETQDFVRRAMVHQREQPRRHYGLAVVLQAEDRLIWGCGLTVSAPEYRGGWIGYCFNRSFWGHGYATEAARVLLWFGFNRLRLHRIFAACDPVNAASARVLEKVGMRREGHLVEHQCQKGRWRDSYLYAILEREWNLTSAQAPSSA